MKLLLDLRIDEFADEVNRGRIEVAARCNNTPCFSLQAIDAYKRIGHAQGQLTPKPHPPGSPCNLSGP